MQVLSLAFKFHRLIIGPLWDGTIEGPDGVVRPD